MESRVLREASPRKIFHPDSAWGGKFVFGHPEMWILLEASYRAGFSTPIQGCLLRGGRLTASRVLREASSVKSSTRFCMGGKFVVGHPEMWALLGASCKTGISTPTQGCLLRGGRLTESRALREASPRKIFHPILHGVENLLPDIQKCGLCLRLLAKQAFPPRHRDAY